MVREHGGAIDAVELASRMKLHVTTVRFHLDALCDEGAIERTRMNRDGVGRPRTGYRAVEERLDYRILAEILAMELGETVRNTRSACPARRTAVGRADRGCAAAKPLRARMVRTRRRWVTRWIEERCSPPRSSTGWGLTPNWLLNQNHRHRCRLIASRCSGGSGSFGCTPARYGIWPEPTPRWVAAYTWGCCRACSTTPRRPADMPDHEDAALSARLEPFVEPELCIARLAASRRSR